MLFSNWHVENLLWGLSKCCALQELVHSRGQDLLRDLYEKQTFHLKTSLVAAWQHQCSLWVPLGLSAFVANDLVSIGAFFKQTLNILMILMSMVYPFLKNLRLAPLYVEILLPLFSIGKLESVLRVSACGLRVSPKQPQSTFTPFQQKEQLRQKVVSSPRRGRTVSCLLDSPEERGINTSPGGCCERTKSTNTHIWKGLSQDLSQNSERSLWSNVEKNEVQKVWLPRSLVQTYYKRGVFQSHV